MSDDLIKRFDAIEAIRKLPNAGIRWTISAELAFDALLNVPSADRPQGEWIIEIDANGNTYGRCSICGMRQYAGQLNFCPDCGAHMKGTDDDTI